MCNKIILCYHKQTISSQVLDDVDATGVVVDTPGGAAVAATPSVLAEGCNPPATPTGGCNMGAGKGGTPEVGGKIAPGGLMPGIIAVK